MVPREKSIRRTAAPKGINPGPGADGVAMPRRRADTQKIVPIAIRNRLQRMSIFFTRKTLGCSIQVSDTAHAPLFPLSSLKGGIGGLGAIS